MDETLPKIFDRELYLARQAKASGEVLGELYAHVATDLEERMSVINHQFAKVLVLAPSAEPFITTLKMTGKCHDIQWMKPQADEALNLPSLHFDAVFHLLDLHSVNDIPGQLAQFAGALKPDGLFMACFFVGETLHELREAWLIAESELRSGVSLRVAPMVGLRELGGLLQRAGLALPVADAETLNLRYGEPLKFLHEIKQAGFSNPLIERAKGLASPQLLNELMATYAQKFADVDGKLRVTLELGWALAWKPHASQQKPLKPGSAAMKLDDALKQAKT
ncbi:MAG: SAM-dependent methyltransferase [Aestuariivirga sp.]